ncbi:scavenger receptor cysteine-rich domain-containing protein DMBT1-like isoform X2 [Oculina patagonica]
MYNSSTDRIHFVTEVMTIGWVGLGVANQAPNRMIGYDVAVGGVFNNGTGYLADYYTVGFRQPPLDPQQDWVLTYSREENGKTTLQFYRQRNTFDFRNDVAIQQGAPIFLIWAYHPFSDVQSAIPFPFHGSASRGFTLVVLIPGIAPTSTPVNATSRPSSGFNATSMPPSVPATSRPPFIGCGGLLNGSSGLFASPGYPGPYFNNLDCVWTLPIPSRGSVFLEAIVFETQSCCDFVELTDSSGRIIARTSGSQSGVNITLRGDDIGSVIIRFTTDSNVTRQGFLARYRRTFVTAPPTLIPTPSSSFTTPPPACGGILFGLSGSFASPGYPLAYTNNLNCTWTLLIPSNAILRLRFIVFETESCCDFVELIDSFGQTLERLSGSNSSFTFSRVGGDRIQLLRVRFTTDSSVTRQGFLAQYNISFVPPASSIAPTPSSSAVVVTSSPAIPPFNACGGTLFGSSGSFASPRYPSFYANNLNCLWTLFIPSNGFLRLQFVVFDTESCCDFVELTDSFGRRLARLSGSRPRSNIIVSGDSTGFLRIRFTTDSSVTRQGFLAQYNISFAPMPPSSAFVATPTPVLPRTTQPPTVVTLGSSLAPTPSSSSVAVSSTPPIFIACGGTLSGSSGLFASPGYPVSYTNFLNCLWTLRIPANGSLTLRFIVFDTESGFDFVELTDILGGRLARLDGSRSGFTITVRGDRTQLLRIRFTSDGSVVRQGFLAQYSISFVPPSSSIAPTPSSSAIVVTSSVVTTPPIFIGCGGLLNGTSGLFASPGYPVSYTNRLNCLWRLLIPANGFLRLQFIVFETERGFDFVELTDSFGRRIVRLDGSRSGFNITIGGDRTRLLNIRFTTDGSVVRQGFLAQYNITVVEPSVTSTPVMSSSVVPPVTIPPEIQRVLVDLLRSLIQLIQRLQALLGGSFSPFEFEIFRNETLQILQQAQNQLFSPSSSQLRNFQKRSIPELSTPQDLVQALENIQRRLLG